MFCCNDEGYRPYILVPGENIRRVACIWNNTHPLWWMDRWMNTMSEIERWAVKEAYADRKRQADGRETDQWRPTDRYFDVEIFTHFRHGRVNSIQKEARCLPGTGSQFERRCPRNSCFIRPNVRSQTGRTIRDEQNLELISASQWWTQLPELNPASALALWIFIVCYI